MANKIDKDRLFGNYFDTSVQVFSNLENIFDVKGVFAQIFGSEWGNGQPFDNVDQEQRAKDRVRSSWAWQQLSDLYDYSVDGIAGSRDPIDIVIGGAEVLSFLNTENCAPTAEWHHITSKGDGRFALDDGQPVLVDKVALLAAVDVRTVRNAISAGELVSFKSENGLAVENASARTWLNGRRGFKPTVILGDEIGNLNDIATPSAFGAFMSAQRVRNGMGGEKNELFVFHPSFDERIVTEIEAGIFNLPIDAAFQIADLYRLDRKHFLACVMRVFYSEELSSLREAMLSNKGAV